MIQKHALDPKDLAALADQVIRLAGDKVKSLAQRWQAHDGAPVYTVQGKYTSRGWTEWTQGFQYGQPLYVFEQTGDPWFLDFARAKTVALMAPHVTNTGVHDHGFNNVSTYGNLLRLAEAGAFVATDWEKDFYRLALKASGAVQAARWTELPEQLGYIYSFNGPQSLFADTIRSLRALAVSHRLGHALQGEKDRTISLLQRLLQHAETTARFNVFYGTGRDAYDERGRTAHESIFNRNDGSFRCPSSQQGFSPFTTWTRGLAWILLGFAEELEYLDSLTEAEIAACGLDYFPTKASVLARFEAVACATADFYLKNTPSDGIPYWDTGAPLLHRLGDYLNRPAEPDNPAEPVDSSAAAIAAQGLLRLADWLDKTGQAPLAQSYRQAGLTTARTLFGPGYLATDPAHEGLFLHAVYHRPNGWDYIPPGKQVPQGEACFWGDYHGLELAVWIAQKAAGQTPFHFFDIAKED